MYLGESGIFKAQQGRLSGTPLGPKLEGRNIVSAFLGEGMLMGKLSAIFRHFVPLRCQQILGNPYISMLFTEISMYVIYILHLLQTY